MVPLEALSMKPPSSLNQWVRKQLDDVHWVARCCTEDHSLSPGQRDAFSRVAILAKAVSRGAPPLTQYQMDDVAAALCAACDGRLAECAGRGYRNRLGDCRLMKDRLTA